MTLSIALDVQTALSKAQKTPVVGPLLVSPYKIVASFVQIVVAEIFAIGFIVTYYAVKLTDAPPRVYTQIHEDVLECIKHLILGCHSIGYALLNMVCLGYNDLQIEDREYFLTLTPP